MSEDKASALRLLVVHDTQSEAEPLINTLRNAGQAVRTHFIAGSDELNTVLTEQSWDIMLAKLSTNTVDVSEAVARVQRSGKDIPIIGLVDAFNSEVISNALSMGLTDVVVEKDEQHLLFVVKRETNALSNRRQLRELTTNLRETEKRCQLLLESSVDAIAYVHEGMHIFANPSYMQLFGYDDIEELQSTPIMDLVVSSAINDLKASLKSYRDGNDGEFNCEAEHSNGERFDIRMTFSEASYEGEPCTQIVIRRDDDKNAELQQKLNEISTHDLVTGLYNRQYFSEALEKAYQQVIKTGTNQLVAYVGITNFNKLKTQSSIAGTDVILKELTELYVSLQPEGSSLARYGDDSLALIMNDDDLNTIEKNVGALRNNVAEHLFEVEGRTVQVDLAFGLAHIDEQCKNGHDAFTQAHQAYTAAVQKKCSFSYFDRSDIANLTDDSMLAKIEHALKNDGFRILFQPVISLRGNSQEHYDALLRLIDKDGNEVPPEAFLPMVEVHSLGAKLDRWVAENAIRTLADHRKHGHNTQVFIHLTPQSIQDPTFLPWVNSALKSSKLPGDALAFQITEEHAQSYLKAAKAFSRGLTLLKCKLALTHYGLLEDGLSVTRHLTVDYIRVHSRFIEAVKEDDKAMSSLETLVKAIHALSIDSIVPHIENAEILASLWELGVSYIQGYYVQSPQPQMNYEFEANDDEIAI